MFKDYFGGQFGSKMLNMVHKNYFFNGYKGSIIQNE